MADSGAWIAQGFNPTPNVGPDPFNMPRFRQFNSALQTQQINNQLTQFRLQEAQRQVQSENALKQFLSDPNNIDQQTGLPNQNALPRMWGMDPQAALNLTTTIANRNAANVDRQSKTFQLFQDRAYEAEVRAKTAYDETNKTQGKDAAQRAAQDVWDEYYPGLDQIKPMGVQLNRQFDYARNARNLAGAQAAGYGPQVGKTPEEQVLAHYHREHPDATAEEEAKFLGSVKQGERAASGSPAAVALQRYLAEHPDASADDIAKFNQKNRAAPRSAQAMAMQKYIEEHPEATSQDIAKFGADYAAETRATTAFDTGKQGDTVRSMNVAVAHLDTLRELGRALQNGDTKLFNRASNYLKDQFGQTAPGNFEAAKIMVGDEVIKAVIGAGGALGDRETAQKNLDNAKTFEQLNGVIDTYQDLMAGQLTGLRKQYETSTKREDFEDKLLDRTREVMQQHGGRAKVSTTTSATAGSIPPKEKRVAGKTTVVLDDGSIATWNGTGWETK